MNDNNNNKKSRLLSPTEVAEFFNVHRMTVIRLINSNKLRAVRVGGQWRIRREWVDEYIERQSEKQSIAV